MGYFDVGDYVHFGSYNNESILWRCMKKDEFGYLMISEYILCFKAFDAAENDDGFGSNKWEKSNIREWLNSEDMRVKYTTQPPTEEAVYYSNPYVDEPGFLSGFDKEDIKKIGLYKHDVSKDLVFLLSKEDVMIMWCDMIKSPTETALKNYVYKYEINEGYFYWTRTPYDNLTYCVFCVEEDGTFRLAPKAYRGDICGIVPALYLLETCICRAGSGTKNDPYLI